MFWHRWRIGRWFFVEVRHTLSQENYYVLLLCWNEYLFVSDSYGIHLFRTILFNWLIHSYPFNDLSFENHMCFFLKKKRGFLVYNEYRFYKYISFQSWYIICFETINNVCFETNVLRYSQRQGDIIWLFNSISRVIIPIETVRRIIFVLA